MIATDLHKTKRFFRMAIGNSNRVNCKTEQYKTHISMSMITIYLVVFALGLFVGDISASLAVNIESVISMVSTVTIAGLGSAILYNCWSDNPKCVGLSVGVVSIMVAQAAYIFNLFSLPIVNSLFNAAGIVTIIILYGISQSRS
jgi:hypothetical protein